MTDLHELLERATDRVEPTGGAAGALATARRRRRTRRGLAASAAVAAVVVGVVAAGRLGGAPSVDPAPSPPTVEPVQQPWDPRDAGDLPAAAADVAPLLPARISVPDLAPRIEDDPVEAAVLSVDDGADVLLLGTDGRWHCVVVGDRRLDVPPVLSRDGTLLSVAADRGTVVVDLATGAQEVRAGGLPTEMPARFPLPGVQAGVGWRVSPLAELADGTALMWVFPGPRREGDWHVVHWDPATDDLSLVSVVDSDAEGPTTFARDLLGPS